MQYDGERKTLASTPPSLGFAVFTCCVGTPCVPCFAGPCRAAPWWQRPLVPKPAPERGRQRETEERGGTQAAGVMSKGLTSDHTVGRSPHFHQNPQSVYRGFSGVQSRDQSKGPDSTLLPQGCFLGNSSGCGSRGSGGTRGQRAHSKDREGVRSLRPPGSSEGHPGSGPPDASPSALPGSTSQCLPLAESSLSQEASRGG